MANFATPNLPARNFDTTEAFYAVLGFSTRLKVHNWMILERDGIMIEFFPHPDLVPAQSWFSCCLHLDDLDGFVEQCRAAGLPVGNDKSIPRIVPPRREPSGLKIAFLVDENGSLLRLIAN